MFPKRTFGANKRWIRWVSVANGGYLPNAPSDWLLKRRTAFAIYLQATCAGFAHEHIVIVAGININH